MRKEQLNQNDLPNFMDMSYEEILEWNMVPGNPATKQMLHALISKSPYRDLLRSDDVILSSDYDLPDSRKTVFNKHYRKPLLP